MNRPVADFQMPVELSPSLGFVMARDRILRAAEWIGLMVGLEHPQPLDRLVDNRQQLLPRRRGAFRCDPELVPPFELAFMTLELIFVNLAPKFLESVRNCGSSTWHARNTRATSGTLTALIGCLPINLIIFNFSCDCRLKPSSSLSRSSPKLVAAIGSR